MLNSQAISRPKEEGDSMDSNVISKTSMGSEDDMGVDEDGFVNERGGTMGDVDVGVVCEEEEEEEEEEDNDTISEGINKGTLLMVEKD